MEEDEKFTWGTNYEDVYKCDEDYYFKSRFYLEMY
jgi:hypothetical protein